MTGTASPWRQVWHAYAALNKALLRALGGGRRVVVVASAVAVVIGGAAGTVFGLRAWFPDTYETLHDQAKLIYAKHLRRGVHYRFEEVHPWYLQIDVPALIRIRDPADAERLRQAVIRVIWGEAGFPDAAVPARIERNITIGRDTPSSYLARLRHLASVDAYRSILEHGLPAETYLMRAERPNRKLVIYLEGHTGPFWLKGHRAIEGFLAKGYDVLGISMPVYTAAAKARIEPIGDWMITNHEDLAFFDRPLAPFFQPVAEALNLILAGETYSDIYMMGFSGGGWTATVYAAIDPRVRKSYQVSATWPMYLRRYPGENHEKPRSWDHFEAVYPPLFETVNYPEIYVMAALGKGRRHMQVLTKYDACCFDGMGWTTYVDAVRERVSSLGEGAFSFHLDTTHAEHKLSHYALELILADMAAD